MHLVLQLGVYSLKSVLHMRITSPACFYHIESLSWDQLNNQDGCVPAVGDLYYELNLISLDDYRIILLDRPFIKMNFIRSRVIYMA